MSVTTTDAGLALAEPGEVLAPVLGPLAGILFCSMLATVLLYAACRCASSMYKTPSWAVAALALVGAGAAVAGTVLLFTGFVDPGRWEWLAKAFASLALLIGVLCGAGLAWLDDHRRYLRGDYQFH